MTSLSFTLLSDGSSDRALLHLLRRILEQRMPDVALEPQWADLRRLPDPPRALADRMSTALRLFPCRLLVVHRDAEGQDWRRRKAEIRQAASAVDQIPEVVCAIPVRMLEAWLLVDEAAIRRAAGNPHGAMALELPEPREVERVPDPKTVLHEALRTACGLRGVRRKRFRVPKGVHRVAELIEDLSPLRRLRAFERLEADLERALEL